MGKYKTKFDIGDIVRYIYDERDPLWVVKSIKIQLEDNRNVTTYEVESIDKNSWCAKIEESALEKVKIVAR